MERRLTPQQLVEIAEGHLEREDRLAEQAQDVLFVDTNALTTCLFARYYHGEADPHLEARLPTGPRRGMIWSLSAPTIFRMTTLGTVRVRCIAMCFRGTAGRAGHAPNPLPAAVRKP